MVLTVTRFFFGRAKSVCLAIVPSVDMNATMKHAVLSEACSMIIQFQRESGDTCNSVTIIGSVRGQGNQERLH